MTLSLRQDQIETLLHVLDYVLKQEKWAVGPAHSNQLARIDEMAHAISIARVQELRDYIAEVGK